MSNTSHNILYIRNLLKSITLAEQKRLIRYLKLNQDFGKRNTSSLKDGSYMKAETQYSNFIDMLIRYKGSEGVRDIEDYVEQRYSVSQIRNITSRLIRRIDDFLLMELTLRKGHADDDRIIQQFLLRRIVILDVLLSRGLFSHFNYISNKLIVLADRYERYLEGATIIRMQMSFQVNRLVSVQYYKLAEKHDLRMKKYMDVYECLNYAVKIQQMYNEKYKISNIKSYLEQIIDILASKTVESDTWLISRNLIFLEYAQQTKNYSSGDLYCEEIIRIYQKNKYISNTARISNAFRQLANNQLLDSRFESSIDVIHNAMKGYPVGSLNWIGCREHIFLAYFYMGEYTKAQKEIDTVFNEVKVKANQRLFSRFNYYNGILSFIKGDFKASLKCLYDSGNLHDDKGGWGFGLRLYIMLIYIEQRDINSILITFDSFRKFYQKYSTKGEISTRYKIIFQIIKLIVQFDLDNQMVVEKSSEYFGMLNNENNLWEVRSPELINFESWFNHYFKNGISSI